MARTALAIAALDRWRPSVDPTRQWTEVQARLAERERAGRPVSARTAAALLLGRVGDAPVSRLARELVDPPAHPQRLRPVDGAAETLAILVDQGWSIGLLSNTGITSATYIRSWLRRSGLASWLSTRAVLFSDDIGVGKPHPRAFRIACSALGWPTSRIVMIGDDLWFDVHGGRAAGLRTLLVHEHATDRPGLPAADTSVPAFIDLPAALGKPGQ